MGTFTLHELKNIFLILLILAFSNRISGAGLSSSVISSSVQPATISLKAKHKSETIKWLTVHQKNVLIVATEEASEVATPELNVNYIANAEYGKGTKVGNGFVVYKGDANEVTIKGLSPRKKYHFTIYTCNASGLYSSDETFLTDHSNSITERAAQPESPQTVVVCVCPPIAGVTCSLTGTTNTGTSVASAAGCPHVGYCDGPGVNNPWTNSVGVGNIQWLFSAPVNLATLRMNSVNTNDFGTISTAGGSGGTISLSGLVCMGVSGLVVGPLSVAGYGGVFVTVNSTGSYTSVTLANTGVQSGFVAACPTAINSVLPIELVSLKGECSANKINLEWKTLTERNNSYFTVERSYNTQSWEVIGQVPGGGNSSSLKKYSFTDNAPIHATIYYRLKQTDFNTEFKYSELISVESCGGKDEVTIYPNPANQEVFVQIKEEATLEVYNLLGEITETQQLKSGDNKIDLSHFNNGTYFFKLSNTTSVLKFSKVIVNK